MKPPCPFPSTAFKVNSQIARFVKLNVLILADIYGNTHLYFKLDHLVFIASLRYTEEFYISLVYFFISSLVFTAFL